MNVYKIDSLCYNALVKPNQLVEESQMINTYDELRGMVDLTNGCMLILDKDGTICHQNAAFRSHYPDTPCDICLADYLEHRDGLSKKHEGRKMTCLIGNHKADVYLRHVQLDALFITVFFVDADQPASPRIGSGQIADTMLTPLTHIHAILTVLQKRLSGRLEPIEQDYFRQMDRNVLLLIRHTRNFADLMDAEQIGKTNLRRHPLLLNDLMAKVVSITNLYASFKGAGVKFYHPGEHLPIAADEFQLKKALAQMISFSLRHTAKGGEVAVYAHKDQSRVQLQIKGGALPQHLTLEQLKFSAHQPTDPELNGLHLAHRYILAHDGSFHVDAPKNHLVFQLTLPLTAPTADTMKQTAAQIPDLELMRYTELLCFDL